MKKPCLALGAAIVLAAHFSAAHAIEFKSAVVGQAVADRTLTIGKLSMQLPAGEWTLASKTSEIIGPTAIVAVAPLATLTAVQTHHKKVVAIVSFSAPAWSYSVLRWNDDPCKSITSFIVKSTMNQTMSMPECFAISTQAAASFQISTDNNNQSLARWIYDNGSAFPDPMTRVFYTKYHFSDFFRLNVYFAGDSGTAPAAEAWGREAASSLSAMVTRSTAQGKLPDLPAFALASAGAQPVHASPQPVAAGANVAPNSAESRLRQLKSLLDSKLITPEEYEGKRKKIVDEM